MKKLKKVKILNKNLSYNNGTSSNQSCRNINNYQTQKGNMLSYGCLNLTLTIELNEKDLEQNNISWENLKNYSSIPFINTNKSIGPK